MSQFLQEVLSEIQQVERLAEREAEELAEKVLQEAKRLCSQRSVRNSESSLGVKTGRLRQSLRVRPCIHLPDGHTEYVIEFDEKIAPHAKYVIHGTRKIKPHSILEAAVVNVGKDDWEML